MIDPQTSLTQSVSYMLESLAHRFDSNPGLTDFTIVENNEGSTIRSKPVTGITHKNMYEYLFESSSRCRSPVLVQC